MSNQNSVAVTHSPNSSSVSNVPFSLQNRRFSVGKAGGESKVLKPFNTGDYKILLLENVNKTAIDILEGQGYQVEFHKGSLDEAELIEKIRDAHAIGIRSKTKLTSKVLSNAQNLVAIGCFCIGTNQVDLDYAAKRGIAVFNSPFSNSRSVAELVIAYIITLARQLGDRSIELHNNTWNKVSAKCWEIRGKTLGIIGYGHIGAQLSVLAESMGMTVIYYDVLMIMGMGTARQVPTLKDLLNNADFVTLHVPELPETKGMISTEQFSQMKNGAYIINASRGSVIDIPALIEARKSGKIAGAAIDVYPHEPPKNGAGLFNAELNSWCSELLKLGNIVLSPHIGGSTEEAQSAIGIEVGTALVNYINDGSSVGAVNFPEVNLRTIQKTETDRVRVLYIHKNVPGVLRTVNEIFADHNIEKQFSDSQGEVAYLMADICNVDSNDIKKLYEQLEMTPFKIRTRILY
ncbi:D-3-phosphoglycerate dehydrogenase 2 [Trichomonascus vanleenenianus]|uniref:D-3-phosphoglycerate dehydrogenase 2 n=1 Tax=Trichomonascus vanleenenianus TaxID=2268995 RepID=UPI003ECB09BE